MIFLHIFCYCISLQGGVVCTAVIGLTIMIVTASINMSAENDEERLSILFIQYFLLYLYLSIMTFALIVGFYGGFWEVTKWLRIGAFLLLTGVILYIIFTVLSFIPHRGIIDSVCLEFRCPDHHWLQTARWREKVINVKEGCEDASRQNRSSSLEDEDYCIEVQPDESPGDSGGTQNEHVTPAKRVLNPLTHPSNKSSRLVTNTPCPRMSKKTLMLMAISVLYGILFVIYCVYTIFTFLAFATQIDHWNAIDISNNGTLQ